MLAHEVAKAEAVASFADKEGKPDSYTAGIATWPGSGITTLAEVAGKSFAYADPASTSGHLFPAYWLAKNGIDPDKGIKAIYAGCHAASFEALRNHKVIAGELNSEQIASATLSGDYKPGDVRRAVALEPDPDRPDHRARHLPAGFKARLTVVLQNLDLSELPANDKKIIGFNGTSLVPQTDAAFNDIRDLVHMLHIDLKKLNS